ncbi:MAG: hypothetical protein QOH41_1161 [Blastocatellia bacterium]|jgi:hypothetical protein|nr:hypothetical protein [Blastocatellia bacterium]
MERARRFPRRLVGLTSLSVCFALLSSGLINIPVQSASPEKGVSPGRGQPQGVQSKKAKPEAPKQGPPEASLPNLDEAKQRRDDGARPPLIMPSSTRSRRKPLEPRQGRKVGDPLPPKSRARLTAQREGTDQIGRSHHASHRIRGIEHS